MSRLRDLPLNQGVSGSSRRSPCPISMRRDDGARPRVVIAIPVRNEEAHIGPCLRALAKQEAAQPDRVLLFLNGCTDGTEDRIRDVARDLDLNIILVKRDLRGAKANAGFARRLALRHAAHGLADDDVLITTDADGQVAPDWIESNLEWLRQGADAVCGRAEIDPVDALLIPPHLRDDDARECQLATLLDELASLIDPDPNDPWPRHTESSGASIAVTVAAFRGAGGIPPVASGEDRAFIEGLRRFDARIRHAPTVAVTVSGRMQGRAAGGMADTIRRRIVQQDEFTDSTIEPAVDRFRRLSLRAHARALWMGLRTDSQLLVQALDTTELTVDRALSSPFFGLAWAALERECPTLHAQRVRFADLTEEIGAAIALRAQAAEAYARQSSLPSPELV
jgi:GT2 family glycosyltransferase